MSSRRQFMKTASAAGAGLVAASTGHDARRFRTPNFSVGRGCLYRPSRNG